MTTKGNDLTRKEGRRLSSDEQLSLLKKENEILHSTLIEMLEVIRRISNFNEQLVFQLSEISEAMVVSGVR